MFESSFEIVRDRVEQMDGRIFQIIGDGIVALFNSAGSAVKSAVGRSSESGSTRKPAAATRAS